MNENYNIKPVALFVPKSKEDRGYWLEIYGKAVSTIGLRYKLVHAGDVVEKGEVDLSAFSGVIITGGRDVDPERYGARRHRKTEPPDHGRDEEIHVVREALKQGLPLLGICRGMQVIAAATGCTITQHFPDYLGKDSDVVHNDKAQGSYQDEEKLLKDPHRALANSEIEVPERRFAQGHVVKVAIGSALARITGVRQFRTNAWHHQGLFLDELAPGVRAAAQTRDGVVEAIELSRKLIFNMTSGKRWLHPFCLGVQWHPEGLLDKRPHGAIFSVFGLPSG